MIFAIIDFFLQAAAIIIFVRVLISWIVPESDNPLVRFFYEITNPILEPISRFTTFGNIDFSPIVVIVIIEILREVLRQLLLR